MKILYIPQIVLLSLALSACGGSSSGGSGGHDDSQTPPAEDSTGNDSNSGDSSGSGDADSNSDGSDDNSGSSDNTDSGDTNSGGSNDTPDSGDTDSNSDGTDDNSGSSDNSGSGDNTDSGDSNSGGSDDSNTNNPSIACLPEWGQEMLDSLNQYRSQTRQCGDDTMPAVGPLSWQCQLTTSSQAHADDMADNNFFSHTGSNGLSMRDRIDAAGYQWSGIGENIAAGYANVSSVMDGWMNSPGHCRNIMSATYTEIGAALVKTSTADYPTYWVQNFGRPR